MDAKGYSKDIVIQGIARVLGGLLSFFAVFILTYIFDEDILGKYNLVLTTVNVITSICTLWLSQSILRYYNDKRQVGTLLVLAAFCSIISIFMYEGYVLITGTERSIWAYIYIVVLALYYLLDAIFRKGRRLVYYVVLELMLSIGRLFPMFIIARITRDYNSVFLSQIITIGVFLVIIILREHGTLISTYYNIDKKELIKYLKFGMPLVGLSISNWFLTSSDRYVIKILGNDAQVGIYSTNYSLGNSIYMMFSLILVNAMHPIIMNLWEKDQKEAVKTVSNTTDQYLLFMIPLVFYGCLKSNVLLGMFKGDSYSAHSSVFIWTVLGIFIYGIALLLHKYYECIQKTRNILAINLIAAAFNIIANFLLIPILGFEAAAFTTFLSYSLYALVVWIRTHNAFPIKIKWINLVKVIISTIAFTLFDVMIVKNNNVLTFFIEGFAYVIYTILFYQVFKVYDVIVILNRILKRKSTMKSHQR